MADAIMMVPLSPPPNAMMAEEASLLRAPDSPASTQSSTTPNAQDQPLPSTQEEEDCNTQMDITYGFDTTQTPEEEEEGVKGDTAKNGSHKDSTKQTEEVWGRLVPLASGAERLKLLWRPAKKGKEDRRHGNVKLIVLLLDCPALYHRLLIFGVVGDHDKLI